MRIISFHFTATPILCLFYRQDQFSSVTQLCLTPCDPMPCPSMSITNSQSLLKLLSIELVMPSNHLTLCCPLLFLPSIFPSIRVFSNESALCIRWPKYWSFSFNISPSALEWTGWITLQSKGLLLLINCKTLHSLKRVSQDWSEGTAEMQNFKNNYSYIEI